MDVKKMSMLSVIIKYFGRKDGQTLSDMQGELKALSAEDKQYLAGGAAKELGLTADQVEFPLA